MKSTIKGKAYSTETATCLGHRYVGEFGQDDGYEERLFVTDDGQHFIYGCGGAGSVYSKPKIKLMKAEKAEIWKQESTAE